MKVPPPSRERAASQARAFFQEAVDQGRAPGAALGGSDRDKWVVRVQELPGCRETQSAGVVPDAAPEVAPAFWPAGSSGRQGRAAAAPQGEQRAVQLTAAAVVVGARLKLQAAEVSPASEVEQGVDADVDVDAPAPASTAAPDARRPRPAPQETAEGAGADRKESAQAAAEARASPEQLLFLRPAALSPAPVGAAVVALPVPEVLVLAQPERKAERQAEPEVRPEVVPAAAPVLP